MREEDPDMEAETDKITLDYDEDTSDGEIREEEESKRKEDREDTRKSEMRGGRGVKKIRKEDQPEEAGDGESRSSSEGEEED